MEKKEELIVQLKKSARKAHDARQRRQYDIVRLFLQGWKKSEIAKIMDMSLQGIYNVLKRYETNGMEGLLLGKAKGRERKLSAEQESELYTVVSEELPKDVGLDSAIGLQICKKNTLELILVNVECVMYSTA